ncbi:2-amino-4-hydroxy-6-hydroxymethyldihydropteridine diphosphokinase [Vreelandella massiliensis]|uniref:2-amino-4-hydroxy-6- hydroxymethyldihydropteridine diphosphokinase n=1 Tax=Vreelandella massiliensis TaxID=1816686 RepID=UPI00096A6167|nr:2-amino-4-hydroxy-6-hydroxymethyldihydropteridine diphosphokinase [Halomonas massiliensis]
MLNTSLAYIGLGSNLEDPVQQVEQALYALDRLPLSRCVGTSSLYRSQPVGPQDQPDFINAVAALETRLSPLALLDQLQALEQRHRRRRERRWGPRTLDLDMLLFNHTDIDHPRLRVPHPLMHTRAFVLGPLNELAPHLRLNGERLEQWLAPLGNTITRLDSKRVFE